MRIWLASLLCIVTGCAASPDSDATTTPPTFEEFKATVYKEPGELGPYVYDGDSAMTEADLFAFYQHYVVGPPADPADSSEEGEEHVGQSQAALSVSQNQVDCGWKEVCPPPPPCVKVWKCSGFPPKCDWKTECPEPPPCPWVWECDLADDVWTPAQRVALTYCVANDFGGNKARIVQALEEAAGAWEAAAGVNFIYRPDQDGACLSNNNNVVFDVHVDPTNPPYSARSAYPHMPRGMRNMLVNSNMFNEPFNSAAEARLLSVITHELGHLLGFVHEHVRVSQWGAAPYCNWDVPSFWRPVTGLDHASIMYYHGCNGSVAASEVALTATDISGAQLIYGSSVCPHSACEMGAPLRTDCNACSAVICAADPWCCSTAWDSICVNEVQTICGQGC